MTICPVKALIFNRGSKAETTRKFFSPEEGRKKIIEQLNWKKTEAKRAENMFDFRL
jgi:hypothetical protein